MAVLAIGVLSALAQPGIAPAAARRVREPASTATELSLRGTHGFRLDLFVTPRAVIFSAFKLRAEDLEAVDYFDDERDLAVGDPGKGLLDVRIGKLGRLRGHLLVRSTRSEAPERGCVGAPTLVEKGVFVGSFHFRGERGYTQVSASRAHGSVTRTSAHRCVVPNPKRDPGRESADRDRKEARAKGEVKLLAADPDYRTSLQAERRKERPQIGGESISFSASVSQKVGDWNVGHYVSSSGFSAEATPSFQVPDLSAPLSEAIVAPPKPFSGSATFSSDGAKAGSWTGDLKVDLPGLPTVPLTGDGIEAGLCIGGAGCTETLPADLQPVLEAGPGEIVAIGVKK